MTSTSKQGVESDGAPAAYATELPVDLREHGARSGRSGLKRAALAVVLVGACLAGAVISTLVLEEPLRTPDSSGEPATTVVPPPSMVGLARLMPEGDLVRVSPPFGAGDARIAAILVAEGDHVTEGTLLARLDNADALESARLSASAIVAQREATVAQVRATVRTSLLEARASLGEARAAADAARRRLERARGLAERGIETAAVLDDLEAAASQASARVARAEATLARWSAPSIATHPDVLVAQAALDAARAEHDVAVHDLAKAEVRAPSASTVLEVMVRAGERPSQNGLMTLGRTDRMMALVEIYQTEIGRVREGQRVSLAAPALAEPLAGSVERVGLVVGRQNLVSDDTAANTDARVVEVLVRLDTESSPLAARLSNLEAVARIEVGN